MIPPFLRVILTIVSAVFLTLSAVSAADQLEIGDAAPDWKNLTGTDDRAYSMEDFADKDAVVICFTCNSCPYAVDYEERMIAQQKKFADAGGRVQLIAINSNLIPADSPAEMKKRAADRKFNFPYLHDATQDVARAYGAIYTPEFFVLNRDRKLVYRGAMDDSTRPEGVTVNYVENAVAATLEGKLPEVTSTGARGCAIRFKRRRR